MIPRWMTAIVLGATLLVPVVAPADAQTRVVPRDAGEMQLSFSPIVKDAAPAVVNVYATRTVSQRPVSPFFDDPFFRRFFGDRGFGPGGPRQRAERSLGSGVIVDAAGVIITNHHVIKGADAVRVVLSDKREFDTDIILKDERTDLAVLRIRDRGERFPHVPFADSDTLEVGDLVLAIGNPFGVGQTVTSGIVSALARTRVGVTDYQFFIQTDAAINPGNSGGALIDMNGRLVGINTAIFSRSGGSNGIGFAIPANMVRLVAESARDGGRVQRPWLGASLQTVTSDIAEGLGLDRPQGALVTRVRDDSPAEKAGLRVSDLIIAVDGTTIDDANGFGYHFATKGIGGSVKLQILRNRRERELEVALIPPPDMPRDERRIRGRSPFAGVVVSNISPALQDELGLLTTSAGALILDVRRGSTAQRVGFRRGDVVVEVNGEEVRSTGDLASIARNDYYLWRIAFNRDGQIRRMTLSN